MSLLLSYFKTSFLKMLYSFQNFLKRSFENSSIFYIVLCKELGPVISMLFSPTETCTGLAEMVQLLRFWPDQFFSR